MKFFHPLMFNNFEKSDFTLVKKLLSKKNPILTQSKYVNLFEKKWSKWLGVKHSVFVNSGSSANLISINILKLLRNEGEVIVPSLTWSSDISSIFHNNLKPVFVDINFNNLGMNEEQILKKINKNTIAVFLTHAQGFNALSENLLSFLKKKNIFLIEDVCESHGASFKKKKLGTFGIMSNFSFYYAHHMSTIEGGMISTNNRNIYNLARVLRSHGMTREMEDIKLRKKIEKKYCDLSPKFIFLHSGYNMRNNEIGALIGLSQLQRLSKNISKRKNNLLIFLRNICSENFYTDFLIEGNSNYAFPLILKSKNIKKRNFLEKILQNNKIEFRRGNAGGGNQLRQPYIKNKLKNIKLSLFPNVEHIHKFGYYIGNFPSLNNKKIIKICKLINEVRNFNNA